MAKFSDFKTFTRTPNYRTTVDWSYLEQSIAHYEERADGCAGLDLEPDFQREHVWTEAQQIAFVEYILRGGTSGREIYFNCAGWMADWRGPFVIVDGKQRLHAVRQFLANKIPAFGIYCKDFEGRIPSDCQFFFNINDLKTREQVLKWYLEMNTGGTPHTEKELEKVKQMLLEETT